MSTHQGCQLSNWNATNEKRLCLHVSSSFGFPSIHKENLHLIQFCSFQCLRTDIKQRQKKCLLSNNFFVEFSATFVVISFVFIKILFNTLLAYLLVVYGYKVFLIVCLTVCVCTILYTIWAVVAWIISLMFIYDCVSVPRFYLWPKDM